MREIVLDTETTGFDPLKDDRIVEIGAVELSGRLPTGRHFHIYLNPERDVPEDAERVHGLSTSFLADKPVFAQEVDRFLEFIGDAPLVIHNASFDMSFINAELTRCGFPALAQNRAIDTLAMARQKFPGAPASLDALCKRFDIDLSARTFHGALLDAQLLAGVYLELCGGRQPDLDMSTQEKTEQTAEDAAHQNRPFHPPRPHAPTEEELAAHTAFLETLKTPLWKRKEGA
ncbi:MAG: DNA polymerase III subunit epsilon [Alphaproteobacteria bacterium]|nr:DNA polymerase III subunit epsilon [Alphaproteobacteria bacterium]